MTDLRKAAQQALETLQQLQGGCTDSDDGTVEAITVWCPEVIEALESALSQPAEAQGEPLFLLHTGQIDSSGEQDEWETEADSQQRVDEFCRQHPGMTIGLYPSAQPVQVPEGWRPSEAQYLEWCDRHDLPERHSREAFDDAVSLHLLAAAPLPPAQPKPQHDTDMEQRWPNAVTPAEHPQKTVNRRLLEALIELREQCSGVSPFANAVAVKSSVLEIRRVGRFMAACEQADEAIAAAKVVESDV